MRRRTALGVVVALAVVAATSTAHATRRERATDRAARATALKDARLSLVPSGELATFVELPRHDPSYSVAVRNDGPRAVVIRSASWYDGLTAPVDELLPPGEIAMAELPQPACPTKRATDPPGPVVITWVAGGVVTKTTLALPDPQDPLERLNSDCELYRASESFGSQARLVRSRPGEVVVDLRVQWNGKRDTVVKALRAADGIEATVAETLPVTTKPLPRTNVIRDIQHVVTVTLRLKSCAPLIASLTAQPAELVGQTATPTYREVQLVVQHPGDVEETLNVSIDSDAANALSAPCRPEVPLLVDEEAGGVIPQAVPVP